MNLYKRPRSPFFYVDVVTPTGQRVRMSTKERTEAKAKARAKAILVETAAPQAPVETLPAITLGQVYRDYHEGLVAAGKPYAKTFGHVMAKTLGLVPSTARRWHLDAAREAHTLTPADLDALRKARSKEGNAPSTTGNELKALRSALSAAEANGHRVAKLERWGIALSRPRERYLSQAEAALVYDHMNPARPLPTAHAGGSPAPATGKRLAERQDAQDLFLALLSTGCRWNEMASLTWSQVRLDDHKLVVKGKGSKVREVPMVPALHLVLARRKAEATSDLVFPGKGGAKRAGPCQAIQHAIDAVGLNCLAAVQAGGRVCIHSLRHTYASWLRQRGTGLDELQRLLGHSTLAVTSRYAKIDGTSLGTRVRASLTEILPG